MLGQPQYAALDAEIREPSARPDFAFTCNCESESVGIVDVAIFLGESLAGEFTKAGRHHRVACFISDALGEFGTIGDLLIDRELHAFHFRLAAAREVANDWIALPNSARAIARNEAG